MLNQKTYSCGICKTLPDQISHHKSHIETQKHKDKRELFEFKLSKLTDVDLEKSYKTTNIKDIVMETETIIYTPIDKSTLLTNKKKLKENICDKIDDITQNMNTLKSTTIEQTNNVSNKEALKDKIHEIHNYLRNNGAGYGMNALKVFNILYGLKKLEENGLFDKVNLKKPDCEFSYLLQLANENKGEVLAELILGSVLDSISDSELKELLFYEIPKNITGSVFVYLIKEIDRITIIEKTCNVLLSGKIYEYFIGRDESAISELGAYFTDRHIVEYILSKLNPHITHDGKIPSMIDMFGGSGGFTTGYINYLNEKYPQLINWTTEINKISHFDMNEDVIKSAGLEFFCLTGVLPNMNNLKYKNSFTDEFNEQKYKYPLTNPPYGGDKTSKTEAQSKREKVKEYIKNELLTITDEGLRIRRQKQLKNIEAQEKQEKKESDKAKVSVSMCSARIQKFAKDNGLKGNDKESCSLMLLMDILEVGGTAIGVLKEGVFFNKTYKDLRKCLVENFNVREVISVPQDQFENTSTKTSIVIFDNTEEKTSEVKFSDLVVERYKEDKFAEVFGDIVVIENKDDIVGVSDTLVSQASKEEILGNAICSLNGKDYKLHTIICSKEYNLFDLDELCEIQLGTRITKKDNLIGNIPVYGGGDISFYTNKTNRNKGTLIISRYAMSKECVRLVECEFYLNDSGLSIHSKNPNLQKYINYFLLNDMCQEYIYKNCTSGSIQKNINMDLFYKLKIPIPKFSEKIQEWVDKISAPYNVKNTKQTQIKELETFVQNRISEIGKNEDCDEVELGSMCDIWCGKNLPKEKSIKGIYNVYGGGNSSYTHNEYNLEGFNIIISRVGNNNVTLVNERFYLTDNGFSLIINDNKIKKYFGYYLLNNKSKIFNAGNGSAQKVISKGQLSKIKIKIPKNKILIQELENTFQQIETLQYEVKVADELYKQLIQELSQEAIPQQSNNIFVPVTTKNNTENEEEFEIIPKKKAIKKVVKKSKQLIIEE
jgi:restriction endonuclease S subunit/type I restriction-modification system DNA methylase subunit